MNGRLQAVTGRAIGPRIRPRVFRSAKRAGCMTGILGRQLDRLGGEPFIADP
jgi:hypothetical protein